MTVEAKSFWIIRPGTGVWEDVAGSEFNKVKNPHANCPKIYRGISGEVRVAEFARAGRTPKDPPEGYMGTRCVESFRNPDQEEDNA